MALKVKIKDQNPNHNLKTMENFALIQFEDYFYNRTLPFILIDLFSRAKQKSWSFDIEKIYQWILFSNFRFDDGKLSGSFSFGIHFKHNSCASTRAQTDISFPSFESRQKIRNVC